MRREPAAETFSTAEADSADFNALTVEQVDPGDAKHPGKLVLVSAFIIVVAHDGDDGDVDVLEDAEAFEHLVLHSVIGEVAGDDQQLGKIIDDGKGADIAFAALGPQVDISGGGDPHAALSSGRVSRSRHGWRSQASRNRLRSPHSFTSMANILGSAREPRKGASFLGWWTSS